MTLFQTPTRRAFLIGVAGAAAGLSLSLTPTDLFGQQADAPFVPDALSFLTPVP